MGRLSLLHQSDLKNNFAILSEAKDLCISARVGRTFLSAAFGLCRGDLIYLAVGWADDIVMTYPWARPYPPNSSPLPPCIMDSNRVELFRNASFTVPVGPLRCLRINISAIPSSSGSSGL